jgi:HAD superfamily hydrolase (TIGR01484 family)
MKLILSDFDGTLTLDKRLGPKIFNIFDLINKNNSELVVVSGRSISWGHFMLTHFPMNTAIMEGGGVILLKDNDGNIIEDILITPEEMLSLDEVTVNLMNRFPDCELSKDSFGRKTDRAIEFLGKDEKMIDEIKLFFVEQNVSFNQSDVHINFWIGDQTKYKAVEKFLARYRKNYGLDDCLYFGDSLNDESMFANMAHSVGVSNIESVLAKLENKPKVVLEGKENAGPDGVLNYLKKNVFK